MEHHELRQPPTVGRRHQRLHTLVADRVVVEEQLLERRQRALLECRGESREAGVTNLVVAKDEITSSRKAPPAKAEARACMPASPIPIGAVGPAP